LEMLVAIFVDALWIFTMEIWLFWDVLWIFTSSQDFRHFCFRTFWVRFEKVHVCVWFKFKTHGTRPSNRNCKTLQLWLARLLLQVPCTRLHD
jgi:hypothetical protein